MKRLLIPLSIFAVGGLFANQISENLAYAAPVYEAAMEEQIEIKKNIGHITIKVGPGAIKDNYKNLIPIFGIGYQSKLSDSSIFQSSSVEFGGSYKEKKTDADNISTRKSEGIVYYPKIMGIHYLNKASENRFFLAAGSNISTHFKSDSSYERVKDKENHSIYHENEQYDESSTTSLGVSAALGLEMGKPTGAVNILKIEYDQPSVEIYSEGKGNLDPRVSVTYAVGF